MCALGFLRVWRNEWLWCHRVFQSYEAQENAVTERELVDQKIRNFMEGLWQRGDPWDLENSAYERDRCVELLKMLDGNRYHRVLEIGCGAGYLTRMLAPHADRIVGL